VDVIEAIKGRRSIRKFKPVEVEEEKLRQILDCARWAPSWANTQCWRFVVVRGEWKEAVGKAVPDLNRGKKALLEAPLAIVICAERGLSGFLRRISEGPITDKGDWWFMFDAALAVQNLSLAAYALDLGTLQIGWFDAKAAAEVLGVPEGCEVVEIVVVGYPDEEPKPPPRRELSEIVFSQRFGQPYIWG